MGKDNGEKILNPFRTSASFVTKNFPVLQGFAYLQQ